MMKRTLLLFPFVLIIFAASAQALSWAYPFVVWDGNVYEVTNENVPESLIGENIGEVETRPDDMTGKYYGNASNEYQIGTNYFEIMDLPTDEGIAVEIADNEWRKAVFAHEAPSHWMDLVPYVLLTLLLLAAAIAIAFYLKKRK
ncbi:hypothetical protein [Bacillus infantis]|uniref:hypothetical protein n=1 Tax=Bacillus infantis TaxID=324767 RepID=UPI003CFAAF49